MEANKMMESENGSCGSEVGGEGNAVFIPWLCNSLKAVENVANYLDSENGQQAAATLKRFLNNFIKDVTKLDITILGVFASVTFSLKVVEDSSRLYSESDANEIAELVACISTKVEKTSKHLDEAADLIHKVLETPTIFSPSLKMRIEEAIGKASIEIALSEELAGDAERQVKVCMAKQNTQTGVILVAKTAFILGGAYSLHTLYTDSNIQAITTTLCALAVMYSIYGAVAGIGKWHKLLANFHNFQRQVARLKRELVDLRALLELREKQLNNIDFGTT